MSGDMLQVHHLPEVPATTGPAWRSKPRGAKDEKEVSFDPPCRKVICKITPGIHTQVQTPPHVRQCYIAILDWAPTLLHSLKYHSRRSSSTVPGHHQVSPHMVLKPDE